MTDDPSRISMKDKSASAIGAFDAFAQKSDTVDLTHITRAIYTGSGGTMKVTMLDNSVVTYVGIPPGTNKQMQIRRLWLTGLTATDVIGEY